MNDNPVSFFGLPFTCTLWVHVPAGKSRAKKAWEVPSLCVRPVSSEFCHAKKNAWPPQSMSIEYPASIHEIHVTGVARNKRPWNFEAPSQNDCQKNDRKRGQKGPPVAPICCKQFFFLVEMIGARGPFNSTVSKYLFATYWAHRRSFLPPFAVVQFFCAPPVRTRTYDVLVELCTYTYMFTQ